MRRLLRLEKLPSEIRSRAPASIAKGYALDGRVCLCEEDIRLTISIGRGTGLSYQEWCIELPSWAFDHLWPLMSAHVKKLRHTVAATYVIDEYRGSLTGLFLLRIPAGFEQPWWAERGARDVTAQSEYSDRELALYGDPEKDRSSDQIS